MSVWPTLRHLVLGLGAGTALRYREADKKRAYDGLAASAESRFVPFAVESFGALGPSAIGFLRTLGSYAKESYLPFSLASGISSLAVILQKGNAEMLAQGILMDSRSALH